MAQSAEVLSNWHHSVEALSTSSQEFYLAVENALKEKEAPSVTTERIDYAEGGILSAKRTYLRVTYGKFVFDICAAPFGKDFFFSWWLGRKVLTLGALAGCLIILSLPVLLTISVALAGALKGILLFAFLGLIAVPIFSQLNDIAVDDLLIAIPFVGALYVRYFMKTTYYAEDTRVMFQETVHRVVADVLAGVLTINNLDLLSPEELKPKDRQALNVKTL